MSYSDDGGAIITGIIVVAVVIIDVLGNIDGAIVATVGAFAAATDFERAKFSAQPPWGFVRFDFVNVLVVDGIVRIRWLLCL